MDSLQRLMIRHTMEMRIGGQVALSLPEAEVRKHISPLMPKSCMPCCLY